MPRSRMLATLAAAGLLIGMAAAGAAAQSVPPPPTRPQSQAETAPAPAAAAPKELAPATPAASGQRGGELAKDIEDQSQLSELDRELKHVRMQVAQAREAAIRFHTARAKLTDLINAGACGGVPSVMQSIARQETETRRLAGVLAESCKGASPATGPALAKTCAEEQAKLDGELKGFDADRDTLRRMCPGTVN